VARVESVTGSAPAVAGVMLRENLEPTGGLTLLGISPDQHLRFESREHGWQPLQQQDLGAVRLPLWLKLVREEKMVIAFRSGDGAAWQQVAQSPLACKVEPFPDGSDTWRPKLHVGLTVAASGREDSATARFGQVAVTARGLLGEYFADDNFRAFRFARPDSKIEFYWGEGSPSPEIPSDHFSVRWTGQLEPRNSGDYHFHLDADNDAWLWVDGKPAPTVRFNKSGPPGGALRLRAGQKYPIKLEFKEGAGAASVRLGWSTQNQTAAAIPGSQLSYLYGDRSPDEEPAPPTTHAVQVPGLWLRHGSFIAGSVLSADEAVTRISFAGRTPFEITGTRVARVILRTFRRALPIEAARDRPGVWLRNGDFLEGDLKSLDGHTLTVRSLLMGQRSFGLDSGEALALLLHPYSPLPAPWEARLATGSVLRVKTLRRAGESLLAEDTTLGTVAIPEHELVEIRSAP
jgi:hypothetical protein